MKQNQNETNDAMSTGELLGKLKQNFAEADKTAPAQPISPAEDGDTDDLDIATLLKQYLPEAEGTAADAELEPAPAAEEPSAFDIDALVGDDAEDELPAEEELLSGDEPVNDVRSGAHFASLLDELDLDGEAEPAQAELPDEPVPAPAGSGVRKYVYHFRPSARNVGQTVKVQETVPQPEAAPSQPVEEDGYFAGRSTMPEFALDDEPVIPDASAFADLIPPVQGEEAAVAGEAAGEAAPEGESFDETDINLMIALGYEDELSKTVGIDRVNAIEKQLDAEVGEEDTCESAAFRGFEYTERAQAKEIMQNYKAEYGSMTLRMLGTLIMLIALFLYENVSLFGVELPGALNMFQYPAVHTLISLQLLVLCGALSWRQLLDGLKGAVTLKPTPQSLAAVAVAVAVIYDVIIAIIAPINGVALYNFPAALCLAMLVLSDMMNLKREIYSFTILADRREKYAVRAQLEPSAMPDEESLTLDIRRASFINSYFARTNRKPAANTRLNYVLLPVVALAIALAIVSFSTNHSGVDALNIFVLTVLFCMPVSTLLACSYPMFRASQLAYEQDAAIIGEASVEEYSGAENVSFADKDVFPSYQVKLRSIKLYGNARPDLVLFAAASVFSQVGGPLNDVLELATKEFDRAESVELTRIDEKGIEAVVEDVNVLVGRAEFLEDYNIFPLHDAEDDSNLAGGARILYIVIDGVLSAKLYVQYDIDVDFEFTLRELSRENCAARIRTYDPNIDDELIASKMRGKHYDVHVEKQLAVPTESDPLPTLDSGLVSRASAKSLIHAAAMCSRLTHVEGTGGIIRGIALGVSLLIMLFLTLLSSTVGISSIYVVLYQLFWMIPSLIITRLFVK